MKSDAQPPLILPGPHASVLEALRTARGLAVSGNAIEVWRDSECVHREIHADVPRADSDMQAVA